MKLYTEEKLRALKKRANTLRLFLILLMGLSLAFSIAACFFVKTANAAKLLLAIISAMTLSGWISILVLNLSYLPAKRESMHMENILKEETVSVEGVLSVSLIVFTIPKSIEIQKVTLRNGEDETTFSVNRRYASSLPANGSVVRVKTAKGYITEAEVIG